MVVNYAPTLLPCGNTIVSNKRLCDGKQYSRWLVADVFAGTINSSLLVIDKSLQGVLIALILACCYETQVLLPLTSQDYISKYSAWAIFSWMKLCMQLRYKHGKN